MAGEDVPLMITVLRDVPPSRTVPADTAMMPRRGMERMTARAGKVPSDKS